MSLLKIESQTRDYSDAYNALIDLTGKLDGEIEKVRDKYRPLIKKFVSIFKSASKKLRNTIEDNPDLFVKPKTQIYHNIKVGYVKGKGRKEFDAEKTIALIKKHFPDESNLMIIIEEKVNSRALDTLAAADLKKIGVNITEAGDEVVIRPVDSETKKMVDRIIEELKS